MWYVCDFIERQFLRSLLQPKKFHCYHRVFDFSLKWTLSSSTQCTPVYLRQEKYSAHKSSASYFFIAETHGHMMHHAYLDQLSLAIFRSPNNSISERLEITARIKWQQSCKIWRHSSGSAAPRLRPAMPRCATGSGMSGCRRSCKRGRVRGPTLTLTENQGDQIHAPQHLLKIRPQTPPMVRF